MTALAEVYRVIDDLRDDPALFALWGGTLAFGVPRSMKPQAALSTWRAEYQ
jgi:hypothetical protein